MEDERLGAFAEITFTKPGTYVYTISEDVVDSAKLPGFKTQPGDITATVTVTREWQRTYQHGELQGRRWQS